MSSLVRRLVPADLRQDPAGRSGFWLFFAHLWTIGGLALSNILLGLSAVWVVWQRRRLSWRWRPMAPLLVPLGVYVIFFTTSVFTSLDLSQSLPQLRGVLSLAILLWAMLLVRGEDDVRRMVDGLLVLMLALAVYGIGQNYLLDYGTLHRRIVGPFSHYQTFAGVLLVGDFLLLARLLTGRSRPWHWLALFLVNWTLLLTLTRGAWVAAVITVTLYVLVRARRHLVVYLATLALGVVLLFTLAPDSWNERWRSIFDLQDVSNYDRLCMTEAGLYMISERPFFGIGPDMVSSRYPIYRHPTAPRFEVPHLHNTFVQLAAEQGLLSLAAYLWLMLSSLRLAYLGYRAQGGGRGPRADLYVGVILVIIGFNLAGLFEDNWRDTEVQRLILFLLAVPVCLGDAEGLDDV